MKSLLFYKPYEVLCQFSASGDKKTLADFFPGIPKNIYPVGRLDYDSEGLLLLSSDTRLAHQLTEPRYGHARTYFVQVEGAITPDALQQLTTGVEFRIDGKAYRSKPAKALLLDEEPALPERNPPIRFRKSIPTSWIALTLTEGRNRQVRRMTAAVGFPTLRLVRYAIGNVSVGDLQPGEYRELKGAEIQSLLTGL